MIHAYIRVSTERQDSENQRFEILKFADARKWTIDQWCDEILALSPDCIEILKATFEGEFEYMAGSFGLYSRLMAPDWFDRPEIREAQRAFAEKRAPDFWQFRKRNPSPEAQ